MPLLRLLLLAQFGLCFIRQNVNECSDSGKLEFFSEQQNLSSSNAEHRYHLTVKEQFSSFAPTEDSHRTDEDQMVEYQSK